jgi:hypothetical protein
MAGAADVPEILSNVCGVICNNYVITELADCPIRRDYGVFNCYAHDHPETPTQVYIASPEVQQWRWTQSMSATQFVLEAVKGRSVHFPKLVRAGRIRRLVFGSDGVQDLENDPEALRPILVIQNPLPYALVSSMMSFSPTGVLPIELALHIGFGMVRALGALHRAGFVHRLVSPHSFSYITPPTADALIQKMLITDLSLCIPWPRRPRNKVPFVGTMRYSAILVHDCREQGPSSDIQSVIFVVAELISGKLPWRSVMSLRAIKDLKVLFPKSQEFLRLPRELRVLYRDMMLTTAQSQLDYTLIQRAFKVALERRDPTGSYDLPSWLFQPCED